MNHLQLLTRYKSWANDIIFSTVSSLPESEYLKTRPTRYTNMVHTLNHVYIIDLVFKAHLESQKHGFAARNTDTYPPLAELWEKQKIIDKYYVDLGDRVLEQDQKKIIEFEFIGGGKGIMTIEEIILHIVNHGTYHRGLVADMMYQVPITPPSTDLPVFLRDVVGK